MLWTWVSICRRARLAEARAVQVLMPTTPSSKISKGTSS